MTRICEELPFSLKSKSAVQKTTPICKLCIGHSYLIMTSAGGSKGTCRRLSNQAVTREEELCNFSDHLMDLSSRGEVESSE